MSKLMRSCFFVCFALSCVSLIAANPTLPGHGNFKGSKTMNSAGEVTGFNLTNATTNVQHSFSIKNVTPNNDGTTTYQIQNNNKSTPIEITTNANGSVQSIIGSNFTVAPDSTQTNSWNIKSPEFSGTIQFTSTSFTFQSGDKSLVIDKNPDETWTITSNGKTRTVTLDGLEEVYHAFLVNEQANQ